jgi:hypothetical protein
LRATRSKIARRVGSPRALKAAIADALVTPYVSIDLP